MYDLSLPSLAEERSMFDGVYGVIIVNEVSEASLTIWVSKGAHASGDYC